MGKFIVAAALFLVASLSGCGPNDENQVEEHPVIKASCDAGVCTVLVWNTTYVRAEYDGYFEWEAEITAERRGTFRDKAPEATLNVLACNEDSGLCVNSFVFIDEE